MIRRNLMGCVALLAASALPGHGQTSVCDGKTERRLNQEYYLGLTDRVYVHAPDISSTGSGGWQAFSLRVLTGTYRKPFLVASALLKEKDLETFLRSRRDLSQTFIAVPASNALKGAANLGFATVRDGERTALVTIRVTQVVPVNGGVDHAYLICSVK
jgi:hypothetical protein